MTSVTTPRRPASYLNFGDPGPAQINGSAILVRLMQLISDLSCPCLFQSLGIGFKATGGRVRAGHEGNNLTINYGSNLVLFFA